MHRVGLFLLVILVQTYLIPFRLQASAPDLLTNQLTELAQKDPDNQPLMQLNKQLTELRTAYQQATPSCNTAEQDKSSSSIPCGICTEPCSPSQLSAECGHPICEICTSGYLNAHQGTLQSLRCWNPQCGVQKPLKDLGHYLGSHQLSRLYTQTIRYLVRTAHLGAVFCPHCGDGVTLPGENQDYGATCSVCQKTCCFICSKPVHGEVPCDQVEKTVATKKLFLRQIALYGHTNMFGFCPHCLTLTEHKDGCSAMVCGQNGHDKSAIPFKGQTKLKKTARKNQKILPTAAGCGRDFSWHARITVEQYLNKYDHEWYQQNQQKITDVQHKNSIPQDSVMGLALSREQLETRLRERRSIEGADLRGVDLRGLDLTSRRFPHCVLDHEQVRLLSQYPGSLESADLRHTELDLEGLNLERVSFAQTLLGRSQLIALYDAGHRNFRSANLSGTDLSGLNLCNSDFTRAKFFRANLSETDLSGATLYETNCIRANLTRTIFNTADLRRVDFTQATLRETSFTQATLTEIDCTNATIKGIKGAFLWRFFNLWS